MLEKITDRVFYMPCDDKTDRPALGLICGDKYSLIVDSGNSPNHAKEFLTEISKLEIAPVKYLVITHWHWDHVFGIQDMNLITIAHENTKEKLAEMRRYKWDDDSLAEYVKAGIYNDFTIECIKKEIQDRDTFTLGDLDLTYEDCIEIDLGGVKCVVKAVGGSHTDDSSVIYVPSERVVFLGDCVYGSRHNGEYGYTQEKLLPMIEKIEKFDADHFLISHEQIDHRKEIDELWSQMRTAGLMVGEDSSKDKAMERFLAAYNREPSEEEAFYIKCFADVNKAMSI